MSKVIELNDKSFDQEIKNSTLPVLVDFWAPWCGPCRKQVPVIEELSDELSGKAKIAKINVDENNNKASEYHVNSIPTLLVFKNGQLVDQLRGFHDKTALKAVLNKYN